MTDRCTLIFANDEGEHFTLRIPADGPVSIEGTIEGPRALDMLGTITSQLLGAAA